MRCLFLFHLYLIFFNHQCLGGGVGVNINVVIQWEVVGAADVLDSCAETFFEDLQAEVPKMFSLPLGLCFW